jgi:tRNA pseudouridine32 synthase / 23S rRNA pseudouridine746 synthase
MARLKPAWVPAPRDGVNASRVVMAAGAWRTVGEFLGAQLSTMVQDWPQRLQAGAVLDAQGQPVRAHTPCVPGATLWYWRHWAHEPRVPFELEVLHQDEQLVVVDKPHFLAVAPVGRYVQETVLVRLTRLLGIDTLTPLHRLDRETAGVLVFSVQPAQRGAYHALWRQHQVRKVYEAVAPWSPTVPLPAVVRSRLEEPAGSGFMQMRTVAGEPNAETRVALLRLLTPPPGSATPAWALYHLHPLTGRRHQLRAHMNALGLPLVGDRVYPRLWPMLALGAEPDYDNPLQLLAREVAFVDPVTGQTRRFTSRRVLAAAGEAAYSPSSVSPG